MIMFMAVLLDLKRSTSSSLLGQHTAAISLCRAQCYAALGWDHAQLVLHARQASKHLYWILRYPRAKYPVQVQGNSGNGMCCALHQYTAFMHEHHLAFTSRTLLPWTTHCRPDQYIAFMHQQYWASALPTPINKGGSQWTNRPPSANICARGYGVVDHEHDPASVLVESSSICRSCML